MQGVHTRLHGQGRESIMHRKSVTITIILPALLFTQCHFQKASKEPQKDGLTLKQKCARFFKTSEGNLDIYSTCKGEGQQGVYSVYNKTRKAPKVPFIVTQNRVIAPRENGYSFATAASACNLHTKLPAEIELVENIFLLLSPKKRSYGMLVDSHGVERHYTKSFLSAPTARKKGRAFVLDFWSKDIKRDVFYHFQVELSESNVPKVLSVKSKK